MRANRELRRGPRRGGAPGRRRRARCASPATSTTCSASRCRSSPSRPSSRASCCPTTPTAAADARPTSRTSRARRCARSARRSAATAARARRVSSPGARTALDAAGIEATIDRPQVALPRRRRGRARLDGARGGDQRDPPQRRAPRAIRLVPALGERPSRSSTTARGVDRASYGEGHGLTGLAERVRRRRRARSTPGPRDDGPRLPPARRGPGGAGAVIRVLLAEDQTMVREALASLLELEDDIEVVAQVGRGDEVARAARARAPRRRAAGHRDARAPTGLEAAAQLRARAARRARSSSSPPSAGPATCAARWSRAPPASCSRTIPPRRSPPRSAVRCAASVSSTPASPPPRSARGRAR